ncbi:MAG: SusC/RagA family TonB-linked outer membrane protein [Bacteroidota bacterium]|nr:SusC/RagA family TonB-linked outer membrane protein [Bacteroidota bacterium]
MSRFATVLLFSLWPLGLMAQNLVIRGSVRDVNNEPLPGANVFIEALTLGATADVNGNYRLEVPARFLDGRTVQLTVSFVGYVRQSRPVQLRPGEQTFNFVLREDPLRLDEVVVTGVVEATPQRKLAFTVNRLSGEQLDLVPAATPGGALAGKIAGVQVIVGSGQPGSGASILLRGPTSIYESNSPLIVVDGVVLGAGSVDIDPQDIESIEVVKGAAAASIYGSRAQAGVIQIRTRRGRDIPVGQTRVAFRNEMGSNFMLKWPQKSMSHEFLTDAQGNWLSEQGAVVTLEDMIRGRARPALRGYDGRIGNQFTSFQDQPYLFPTYDHFRQFYNPGQFVMNQLAITHNSPSTNVYASFANTWESGILWKMKGYNRHNFRLNVDHRLGTGLEFSSSAYYMYSDQDDPFHAAANPFFQLWFFRPYVDLTARDEKGKLIAVPDRNANMDNPLYIIENVQDRNSRQRFLGNARLKYAPTTWFNVEANLSYDRSDRGSSGFYPRGYESITSAGLNIGRITESNAYTTAMNGDLTASFFRDFGPLATRTKLRYSFEIEEDKSVSARGDRLIVEGVKSLAAAGGDKFVGSSRTLVRSEGYYLITGLEYRERYLADFLIRRDGSSLFGPRERWHTYYRFSAAWRASDEPWWPLKGLITDFKPRYSYGTAGGRPRFSAQYETYSIGASGTLTKGTLGNPYLKPELQIEQEIGLDLAFFNRISVELVRAFSTVKDQLVAVPLPGFYGFGSQWQNAGTLRSNTWELSVNAQLVRTRDLSWTAGVVWDRTRQKITEFNRPPFRDGYFYYRQGEVLGAFYGNRFLRSLDELPSYLQRYRDQFQVNDDGYLVWVGAGNSWRDGFAKRLWGTSTSLVGDNGRSYTFNWGIPIREFDELGQPTYVKLGDVVPDFNFGFNTQLRYKGLTVYMLWQGQYGGKIYNNTRQWAYRDYTHADFDQAGKPDELKKPVGYYAVLYNVNSPSSHFVEDGTYVKLRELSVGYTFDRAFLSRFFGNRVNRLSLSLVGRNLLIFTRYSGMDPEVGTTLWRVDEFDYPRYRTLTARVEIEF